MVSGVGAGKTWAGNVEIARMPPGSIGVVAAPTFRMLYDATLMTFHEVCGRFIAPNGFSKSEMRVRLIDDKVILFRSADDPERLRGPNLGWFWLDEAALMPELAWEIMIGRLRLQPGRAWVTTTPRGKVNWVYKVFVTNADQHSFIINCPTSSNTFLPDFFIDTLDSRYTGVWKSQEFEGEFVDFGMNQAYAEFRRSRNVLPNVREKFYNPRAPLYLCMDFNVAMMSWPCVQVHPAIDQDDITSQPAVVTEITAINTRNNVRDMCQRFRREFPQHTGTVYICGDASGGGGSSQTGYTHYDLIDDELRDHYEVIYLVPRSNPPTVNRILTMNDLLRGTGLWQPLIMDEEECPVLVRDLESVILDESGTDVEKIRNPSDERYYLTHSSDAIGYFAATEVPTSSIQVSQALDNVKSDLARERVDFSNERDSRPHGAGLEGI